MKRCPTCNRTYTDPNLTFCTDDGTPLTTIEVADDAPAYRPPSAYVPPGATPPGKQRRAWPWIVGILGAFLLGAVVLMVAAAVLVPRMMRSRHSEAPPPVATSPSEETKQTESAPEHAGTPAETSYAAAPSDEQQVLAQLTDIENDWTVANMNADKKQLERILADDYVGQGPEGGLQGKKEYIKTIQRDTDTERWELNDLKVHLAGDRATLTGKITFYGNGRQAALNFTDKFVWRSGRWQATASEVQPVQ
jgi:hypothetical protein